MMNGKESSKRASDVVEPCTATIDNFALQQLHDDVDQLTRDKKKALGKLNKVHTSSCASMSCTLMCIDITFAFTGKA